MPHNLYAPLPMYSMNSILCKLYSPKALSLMTYTFHDLCPWRPLSSWTIACITSIPHYIYLLWPLTPKIITFHDLYPAFLSSWSLSSMTCTLMTSIIQNLDLTWLLASTICIPYDFMTFVSHDLCPPWLLSYKTSILHEFYTPLPLLTMISLTQDIILQDFFPPWSLSSMTSIFTTLLYPWLLSSMSSIFYDILPAQKQHCHLIINLQ